MNREYYKPIIVSKNSKTTHHKKETFVTVAMNQNKNDSSPANVKGLKEEPSLKERKTI